MPRIGIFLVSLLMSFSIKAVSNGDLLKNLSSRLHELPHKKGALIKSFNQHSQSYIYDQALAIIAFSKAQDKKNAKKLLEGLESLQMQDGSLYFSYFLDGSSPYPREGDKRIAGAISWVAIAANHYQYRFRSKEFVGFNQKILNYLKTQMETLKVNGELVKAIKFAPSDLPSTPFRESDTAALEHNLDAYIAFHQFNRMNKKTQVEALWLKKFILSMWDKTRSHFWSGASLAQGIINKSELYLDNQTWSLLALDKEDLKKISAKEALEFNCDSLFVQHEGITGFLDSKPTRGPASEIFVWSEGTLGQILAMKKIGSDFKCGTFSANELLQSVKKMKKKDGGIAYSTTTKNPDFTTSSSVAGTAWMYFAQNNFNPFQF